MQIRGTTDADRAFIVEMARQASGMPPTHPVPPADDPGVLELVPESFDLGRVATDGEQRVGAVWCVDDDSPLVPGLPELVIGVAPGWRGRGVGALLLDELCAALVGHAPGVCLNVHLLNPAVRLYVRTGFVVDGRGHGRYGVAMTRAL